MEPILKTNDEWKKELTPEEYRVLREKGTEAPFSGKFFQSKDTGMYVCAACGSELFSSKAKYDSDEPGLEGWPSFSEVAKSDAVELIDDNRYGMHRVEVICRTCGSHLGHIFDDRSSATGKHYCINSAALDFKKQS